MSPLTASFVRPSCSAAWQVAPAGTASFTDAKSRSPETNGSRDAAPPTAAETAPNPRGLVELSAEADSCHCALPAGQPEGQALLFDAANLCALNTVQAHRSKLAAMALSPRGELLATASEKGTVIRVHTFPQGGLAHTFRRGSMPATISSLAFSPGVLVGGMREASAVLLAAASTTGTVHVWRLDAQRGA